jgi:serine/threonine protein kinase
VSGHFPPKRDFESPSCTRAESRGNRGRTVIGPWLLGAFRSAESRPLSLSWREICQTALHRKHQEHQPQARDRGHPEDVARGSLLLADERTDTSPTTDIYNLGCVLCYLITGAYPFRGNRVLELMRNVVSTVADRAPLEVPARVRAAIETMLAIDPKDRFESAGEVASELERVADSFPAEMDEPERKSWWRRI